MSPAQLRKMRPAREVLSEALGKTRAEAILKRRGRPVLPVDQRKVTLNMRVDREVIEAFKATGSGWQTRINDVLRDYAASHHMLVA